LLRRTLLISDIFSRRRRRRICVTKCAERIVISSFTIEAVVVYPTPRVMLGFVKSKKGAAMGISFFFSITCMHE
jgi:hypothetical protein